VVFDSTSSATAGAFTFRFWINDVARPTARLLTRAVPSQGSLRLRVTDSGSGVDPKSMAAAIDGNGQGVRPFYSRTRNRVTIPVRLLRAGTHRLVFRVSDYQETKNMEDVALILPNTRTLSTTFRVR
jgi:hypothetical protein